MKRVLITGAGSYIGTSFENWVRERYPGEFSVDTVDMVDGSWREKEFAGYDAILHVAGIVHQKETSRNKELYYKVNRNLAIETAQKAKRNGVKQFILLSSMSVYGLETGLITKDTVPVPKSNYGKSKLEADIAIQAMDCETFKVAIIRPPMIYGKGCKGNYRTLSKTVLKFGIFPLVHNERSMLYIDNLSYFIKCVLDSSASGIFCPQNIDYVCTSNMAFLIGKAHRKKIRHIILLEKAIPYIPLRITRKVFGNLVYEKTDVCSYVSFGESIRLTEK